jgi:hypothetical protein
MQRNFLKARQQSMIFTEERSKRLSEFFNAIKIVKFNGWETIVKKIIVIIHITLLFF